MKNELKNINQLPNEVLLDIFNYLDKKSLNNVIKVCQRWRSIISTSTNLTNRIDIVITPSSIFRLINDENDFPYHSIMLNTLTNSSNETANYYNKNVATFAAQHPEIEWVEVKLMTPCQLKHMVKPFRNLVHLNLVSDLNVTLSEYLSTFEVSLPQLKYLGIKGSTNLLKLIKDHQIETLKVIDSYSTQVSVNLSNFLKTADKISRIKFMGFIPQLSGISDYKFKLKEFSVLLKGQIPTNSEAIFELIQHQSQSINYLKLIGFNMVGFIEFAVSEMKLEKLEIDFSKSYGNLDRMNENSSIKRLMLQFISRNISNVVKVIEKCKNCEDLKIVSNTVENFNDWLTKSAKSLENLRVLEIDTVLEENLPKVIFKNVETLKVGKISSDQQAKAWLELAGKCPKVKKLFVSGWNQVVKFTGREKVSKMPKICGSHFLSIVSNLKHLKQIFISGNYKITDEIIFALVTIDKLNAESNLRKFKFCTSEFENQETLDRVRILQQTKIQCTVMPEVKEVVYWDKNLKRRYLEN